MSEAHAILEGQGEAAITQESRSPPPYCNALELYHDTAPISTVTLSQKYASFSVGSSAYATRCCHDVPPIGIEMLLQKHQVQVALEHSQTTVAERTTPGSGPQSILEVSLSPLLVTLSHFEDTPSGPSEASAVGMS